MQRFSTYLLIFVALAICMACRAIDDPPVYQVQVELRRMDDDPTSVRKTSTEARLLDPWAIYAGRCDLVMEVFFQKGLINPQPVGEQIPIKIEGDRWTADFRGRVYTGYRYHLVGDGRLDEDTIEGSWTRFDVDEKTGERPRYRATITGSRKK
jgi:hypothetical protein